MDKTKLKLYKINGKLDVLYAEMVDRLTRERYSLSAELATIRQRDEKPDEFAAYNAFVEECKAKAKEEVYGNDI